MTRMSNFRRFGDQFLEIDPDAGLKITDYFPEGPHMTSSPDDRELWNLDVASFGPTHLLGRSPRLETSMHLK